MKDHFNINALNKITGACGCIFIDKPTTKQNIYMLVVNSRTASLSKLTGTKDTDLLAKYNLVNKKLKSGIRITGTSSENFKEIIPASGNFIGYIE